MMRRGLAAACLLLATTAQASVAVRDGMGNSVVLPAPAKRIVVLVPHAVETLYAIGAGKQLVAAVDYSDYPPAARRLPRVGGYSGLNVEAILQQQPDLIVAWRDGGNLRTVQKLRQMGIPVYYSAPVLPADIPREMRALGTLTGQQAGAEAQAVQFEQRMSRLQQRYRHSAPLRVFMQIGEQPVFTVSGQSFLGSLITLCGGRNVFGSLGTLAPTVGVEAVLAANPEAIVASGMGLARPEWLDQWKRWPGLAANANGHLFFIPPDILQRHTPRILDGATRLCEQLESVRAQRGDAASAVTP